MAIDFYNAVLADVLTDAQRTIPARMYTANALTAAAKKLHWPDIAETALPVLGKVLVLEPRAGDDVDDCVKLAYEVHKATKKPVHFTHNGTRITFHTKEWEK